MKSTIIFILLSASIPVFAQVSVDSVLANVERNNTALLAYRRHLEAEKLMNKTGLTPADPEIEFNILWGNPSLIGNRNDFSIRQSFDFPTAYAYRHQISTLKNEQAEFNFHKQYLEIIHHTRRLCIELTYQNAREIEFSRRHENALRIAELYKSKLDYGETSMIEYNKVRMHMLNLSKDLDIIRLEKEVLLAELARFNGGKYIDFSDSVFPANQIPSDFDQWYSETEQSNPSIQWMRNELDIARKTEQLQFAQTLPSLFTGYMSESNTGQAYRGVMLGVSIPLWENKNALKYTRSRTLAVENQQSDLKIQYLNEMQRRYNKFRALQQSTQNFRTELKQYSNETLLLKALEKGEISLGDYLIETMIYYESNDKLLEMERSMNETYNELIKYK